MRKITLFALSVMSFFILTSQFAHAQSVANYTTARTTGITYTSISGTGSALTGTWRNSLSTDDNLSAAQNIGFTFYYDGVAYTQFSVSTNGFLTFNVGTSAIGSLTGAYGYQNTQFSATGGTVTTLAPFYDDQQTAGNLGTQADLNATYKYLLSGSAPNRVATIEWINSQDFSTTSTSSFNYQIKLYEADGHIEFIYGTMTLANTSTVTTMSYSLGINAPTISASPTAAELKTQQTVNTNTFSNTASNSLGGATPANMPTANSMISFTPQASSPAAPTTIAFSSVTLTSMNVGWTDNSTTETFYTVQRSTNVGGPWSTISTVTSTTTAGTGTTYSASSTGLSPSTTYYYQIFAANEGTAPSTALTGNQATGAPSLTGTKTVGPTGDYTNLTAAITAINSNGLAGPLTLSLQSTYVSSGETYPLTIGAVTGLSSTNTLTIQPSSTGLSIAGSNATAIFDLNAGSNVIIDGRVNGTGSTIDLTISNTNTSGAAIRYINEAQNNLVKYCNIMSVNTGLSSGTIFFSTTTGANGNDGNRIDNCNIRDGSTTPTIGVYSAGTTTSTATNNSNDTISNCNIFNFYNSTSTTSAGIGVSISSGTTDWVISSNSFYQTGTRSTFGAAATWNGILISNSSGNNFQITGNYIGGTAANCGSTAMTLNASTTLVFRAIQLTVGTTTATSLQNNTIQNISVTTTSTSTAQSCIGLVTGKFNCGTTTGNTIGSGTGTGSITFSTSAASVIFSGILAGTGTGDIINIQNNIVGSIAVTGAGTVSFRGIGYQGANGSFTVSGNTVGSTATANSITNSTNSSILGIFGSASLTSFTHAITTNTVANLTSTGVGTSAQVIGILAQGSSGGAYNVTGNTVRNLTTASTSTSTGTSSSIIGISYIASTTSGATVQQNIVHTLVNNPSTAATAVWVTGIAYNGPTSGTNLIARNFVHSITSNSTSTTAVLNGIYVAGGTSTFQNNMVRIGINAAGSSITAGYTITGIHDAVGTNNYLHNSVYIGGTGVTAGSSNTVSFLTAVTTNTRIFRNNIFINEKTNSGGTGFHLAAQFAGAFPNATGLTLSHNLYLASTASITIRGTTAATNYSVTGWQAASNADASSSGLTSLSQISFVNATGDATAVDLHLTGTTGAEGSGTASSTVTDDYDGGTRSGLTPVDIGADAGNFTALDVTAPVISYTTLSNSIVATSRTITGFATITDNVGISSGASNPRFYYKKSTDNDAFVGNTSSDNGWKYVIASNSSSPYDFTIDYTILNGGSVATNDVIQYFVVAQDAANNLGSFPAGATASGNPPVQNINGKATTPSSYTILGSLSGTKTVGSGGDYTTLKGAFDDINAKVVSGNITLSILSGGTTETATASLNQVSYSGGTWTITISPASGQTPTITGALNSSAIIKLNGADNVVIDGSNNGGTSKDLTITNSSTTAPSVIWLASQGTSAGCTSNTIKNCNITTGIGTTTGYHICLGGSTLGSSGADNDNVTIQNNTLTNAIVGIYAIGTTTVSAGANDNLSVSQNTISSNSGNTVTNTKGMQLGNCLTASISRNTLTMQSSGASSVAGISCEAGFLSSTITRNNITSFSTNTGGEGGRGITVASGSAVSSITISNNVLTGINGTNWSSIGNSSAIGIALGVDGTTTTVTSTAGTINLYNNTVHMTGNYTGSGSSAACLTASVYVGSNVTALDIRNNIFTNSLNNQNAGGTASKNYVIYSAASSSAFTTMNYNDYYTSGTQGVLAIIGGTDRTTLSAIQSNFGGNGNSTIGNPQFASATDVSYVTVTSSTSVIPTLNSGVTGTGVTTDYTGTTRDATYPDMGAYEFTSTYNFPSGVANTTLPGGTYSGVTWSPSGASTLTFSSNVTIDGTLTLSNGTIDMGANTITIGTSTGNVGSITRTGGSIKGSIKRWFATNTETTSTLFPLGVRHWDYANQTIADDYIAPSITFKSGGPTTGGTVTVKYDTSGSGTLPSQGDGNYIPAPELGVNLINLSPGYWTVTAGDGLSGVTYDIDFIANGMGISTTAYQYTGIVKKTNHSDPWVWDFTHHTNTTSPSAIPSLHGKNFTNFSEFGVAGNVDNLLPVELSTLTASVDRRNVNLKWTTAFEDNNVGFDIERKPASSGSWAKINFVQGNGTTNSPHSYTYEDRNLSTGKYNYRLKQMDNNGNYKYYNLTTLVEIGVPTKYDMSQNYPNPFNPTTKINYDLPFDSKVSIRLFDMTGREVSVILNETVPAGYQTVQVNGANLASGIYFYNIIAVGNNTQKYVATKKMILVK